MGIRSSKIHFKYGFPPVEKIETQFKKQTGLYIYVVEFLNSLERVHIVDELHRLQFFTDDNNFSGIDFYIEDKIIRLEYGTGCFYFPTSLEKTLYDLGGRFVNFENQEVKDWKPPKSWKKLKHWDDYKWYNRPRR